MNILMIAPNAPPKNSAEAIQVGRYLQELDKHHNITLVTTPVERSWIVMDSSLEIKLSRTKIITLCLPMHKFVTRLLATRYFKRFLFPDKDFWIFSKPANLINRLHCPPDIIYSRSFPLSAALLAREVKKKLGIPWVMHLSDPWCDNPYQATCRVNNNMVALEKSCFNEAESIAVTTKSLARFYRDKYPLLAKKIIVSPNVMPPAQPDVYPPQEVEDKLTLVYTGALYGQRRPTTILRALEILARMDQCLLEKIAIQFIGNISEDIILEINAFNLTQASILGRRKYEEVLAIQAKADILISIEPDGKDPLLKTFLPSKVLDYIAACKPVLAITPENSESWKLCNSGYGWAIQPGNSEALAHLLYDLLIARQTNIVLHQQLNMPPPAEYSVITCVKQLTTLMTTLSKSH